MKKRGEMVPKPKLMPNGQMCLPPPPLARRASWKRSLSLTVPQLPSPRECIGISGWLLLLLVLPSSLL